MARTIFRIGGGGFLAGNFDFGKWGGKPATPRRIVSDGDTVSVSSSGNFPIRFLGIDTPEISIPKPGTRDFEKTDAAVFQRLLTDPFAAEFGPMDGMEDALRSHIAGKTGPEAAAHHHALAEEAEDALEDLIIRDAAELAPNPEEPMRFFLAFAYDALEYFGRLLAYVHPSQPDTPRAERKKSYNERMLATGLAAPYFIFPNVDPFRAKGSPIDAAFDAGSPQRILERAPSLRAARAAVAAARAAGDGMFDRATPLAFEAFELRYLARRAPPSRWWIDLSGDDKRLRAPQRYFEAPNAEDRLWVPAEFAPLFQSAGWAIDGSIGPSS